MSYLEKEVKELAQALWNKVISPNWERFWKLHFLDE